jgi:spermidine/putrescine transport system permease protein
MERGFAMTLIGMVYDFFPFMLLPIYTILADMDKGLIEASADLGSSALYTFFKVRLPLSVPGIVSGVLMVFMPTVSSFAVYDILGYDGGNAGFLDGRLFGNIVYAYFEKNNYYTGSALALVLLVLIFISTLISDAVTKGKTVKVGGTIS